MEEGRSFIIKKKPKLILSKSFPVFEELNLDDKGVLSMVGILRQKRIEAQPDGMELNLHSIEIIHAEKVDFSNANKRI